MLEVHIPMHYAGCTFAIAESCSIGTTSSLVYGAVVVSAVFICPAGVPVETLLDAIDCIGFDAELLEAREEAATQRDGVFGKERGGGGGLVSQGPHCALNPKPLNH